MTGYSETPLAKKLGIKPGSTLALVRAPKGWQVPDLPEDVKTSMRSTIDADVIVAFFRKRSELEADIDRLGDSIFPDHSLWIVWPRKAAGHVSDIDENGIRSIALPTGLVDVKVAAVDEDWSGLKLMWRKENRKL